MGTGVRREIDPVAVRGAMAVRGQGFTDAEIVAVFGHMPPIDLDRDVLLERLEGDLEAEEASLADVADNRDAG